MDHSRFDQLAVARGPEQDPGQHDVLEIAQPVVDPLYHRRRATLVEATDGELMEKPRTCRGRCEQTAGYLRVLM